ncbi:prepilin peptidase [Thermoflavimicrobium dichotomicum]|uniref:Type IV leader peptidase family protein n=1 Tax=Thermoflavimicrobium dichotomicum TaxID=46223 RepID=A0A1I3QQP9_9BACL|nr:A24 family peptidase [Thermoflavimicrobium dichotomicum]SFJ36408.1 Type IV leader peptidase family protein [Thermoflavimicrobium dichotomicum]
MELFILEKLLTGILLMLLTVMTLMDLRQRWIDNRFIVMGILSVMMVRIFYREEPWWDYLMTGLLVFAVLETIVEITDERSLGGGDSKIFAMIGFAVGWKKFVFIFFLSHLLALIFLLILKCILPKSVTWHSEFPFVPFILCSFIFVIF